jgi:hypothetical protein
MHRLRRKFRVYPPSRHLRLFEYIPGDYGDYGDSVTVIANSCTTTASMRRRDRRAKPFDAQKTSSLRARMRDDNLAFMHVSNVIRYV